MNNQLKQSLEELNGLLERHSSVGAALYEECEGHLFPCDGLSMAVLDRSLNVTEGFLPLMGSHGYIGSAALLRFQLDNILRLHGVATSADPHGVAEAAIGGARLYHIKDGHGQLMRGSQLLEALELKNPGITRIYKWGIGLCSPLARACQSFPVARYPLRRRPPRLQDRHIPPAQRQDLVNAFTVVTTGVLSLVAHWPAGRRKLGSREDLQLGFTQPS